jgi:DNA replication protein DnaC
VNLESLLNHIRLPRNHWECKLSEIPDAAPYKDGLREWAVNVKANVEDGKNLLLFGRFGYGKSGSAAIVMKAALSKSILGLWVSCEMLTDYKIREDDYMFSENLSMWQRAQQVPLLVLDDLIIRSAGARKSDFIETTVEFLIRRRIDNRLSTIITTNEDAGTLRANSPAIASLLNEGFTKLLINHRDFRSELKA